MCELISFKIHTLDKNETDLWFKLFYKKVISPYCLPVHVSTVWDSSTTIALILFSDSCSFKAALNLSSVSSSADANIICSATFSFSCRSCKLTQLIPIDCASCFWSLMRSTSGQITRIFGGISSPFCESIFDLAQTWNEHLKNHSFPKACWQNSKNVSRI